MFNSLAALYCNWLNIQRVSAAKKLKVAKGDFDDKSNAEHRAYLCLSTAPSRGPPFNYSDLVTRSPHALYTLALQHIVT